MNIKHNFGDNYSKTLVKHSLVPETIYFVDFLVQTSKYVPAGARWRSLQELKWTTSVCGEANFLDFASDPSSSSYLILSTS